MLKQIKILCVPANEGGCAYYRVILPYQKLAELHPDKVQIKFNFNPLGMDKDKGTWEKDWDFEDMKWADIIVANNICNFGGQYTARICGKAKEFGKFFHYDTDDLLTELYDGHRLKKVYEERGLSEITKFIYNNSDLVTVTQRKFAERISPFCGGVLAVVKNAIDYNLPCWKLPKTPVPKMGKRRIIRVGWAGGIHHEEDVKEFAGIPHYVNQRVGKENVRWDFYGRPPIDKGADDDWQLNVWDNYQNILLRGFKGARNWNIHPALPADKYGAMYANMDIAIAPLQMNAFNDSKSEIKVAECGRYKVPLIASNVGCYDETIKNGKTGYLIDPDSPRSAWVKTLTKVIKDHIHRELLGETLHEVTEQLFDLNKMVTNRLVLYNECFEMLSKKKSDRINFDVNWRYED